MDKRVQLFEQAADAYFSGSAPGGAVLVSAGRRVIWTQGVGLADLEAKTAITPDTRFLIGSVSKQFTAMAILVLAEKGKLGLDDPITRFFPSFPAYGSSVTLRHLLTHTSGIPEYLGDAFWNDPAHLERDVSVEDVIAMIHDYPEPDFEAGTSFSYCNSAYVLLGDVIQQASGSSYEDFIYHTLLRPAGMERTIVGTDPHLKVDNLATGYHIDAAGDFKASPYTMATIGWADGNLISTVGDLYLWHRMLQDHPPVGYKWLKEAWTPQRLKDGTSTGYGFGWFIHRRRGLFETWHSGGTQGYTCRLSRFSDQDACIVVLTNYETSPRDALVGKLARSLLGEAMDQYEDTTPTNQAGLSLVGHYRNTERDLQMSVEYTNDVLTVVSPLWSETGAIPLFVVKPEMYRLDSPHDYYLVQDEVGNDTLILDANGRRIQFRKV